jgi:hypothetical protein
MEKDKINSKEELIKIIEELWNDALSAYYNYNKIQDYRKLYHKYSEEMGQSPNYHSWEYKAAHEVLFMALARLYDLSGGASLKWLLGECIKKVKEKSGLFSEYSAEYDLDGESYNILYMCKIMENEESYFNNKEEIKKKIKQQKNLNPDRFIKTGEENICTREGNPFVRIELSLEECLCFYNRKINGMKIQIENLKELRNKKYAHKDCETILKGECFKKEFPLYWKNIKDLMEYSVDLLQFLSEALHCYFIPDIESAYNNDLEDSLKLIHFALEYGGYDKF